MRIVHSSDRMKRGAASPGAGRSQRSVLRIRLRPSLACTGGRPCRSYRLTLAEVAFLAVISQQAEPPQQSQASSVLAIRSQEQAGQSQESPQQAQATLALVGSGAFEQQAF